MSNGKEVASKEIVEKAGFEVRWENFRGFSDTGWLAVRPLTVLLGSNNSGKTALHTPLLLLKQTLRALDPTQPLVTNGDYVNAGSYRDLILRHEARRPLHFSLRWHHLRDARKGTHRGDLPPGALSLTFELAHTRPPEIRLKKYEVFDVADRRFLTRTLGEGHPARYSLEGLPPPQGSTWGKTTTSGRRIVSAMRADEPHHFLFEPDVVMNSFTAEFQARHRRVRKGEINLPKKAGAYYSVVSYVSVAVHEILDGLSYIGPLRERPQRLYQLSGEPPLDVGTRGESAPEILYRDRSLLRGVSRWMRRFGLAHSIECEEVGGNAFVLLLRRTPKSPTVNVADTGFGVSQLLPLIVEALHGREHTLTIAEQPEIHLNPRLQGRLADLFTELANSNRAVLVETHSEHLIMRLRTLIARGDLPSEKVALYYIEKSGDKSTVRNVPIHTNGHIAPEDWPAGFFEESLNEAMALAAEQIKKGR